MDSSMLQALKITFMEQGHHKKFHNLKMFDNTVLKMPTVNTAQIKELQQHKSGLYRSYNTVGQESI